MKAFIPEKVQLPDRKVLTITSMGDPNKVGEEVFSALYGTAFGTRFKVYKPKGLEVKFGKLTALWPDAHLKPKDEWTGIWAIPVPDFYEENDLVQKDPDNSVKVEIWKGGTYAQVLHLGSYSEEEPTIKTLHEYIKEEFGMDMKDVPGIHEEEYLTSPDAKVVKTIIRYRIS
ncbi:MAG: GyrI-like domain-containing protein [bacterium]